MTIEAFELAKQAIEGEVVRPVFCRITISVTGLSEFAEGLEKAKESLRRRPSIRPVIKMIDGDLNKGAIEGVVNAHL